MVTKANFEPKLNDEQRMICIRMHAEGSQPKEILSHLLDEYKVSLSRHGLYHMLNSKRAAPFIKKFREDYMRKIKDVPIANKRIRIDDLEMLRQKCMKALEGNVLKTQSDREEFRYTAQTLNNIIVNAREEMEKKPQLIAGLGLLGEFSDKSDDDLIARKDELVKQAVKSIGGGPSRISDNSEGIEESGLPESD